MKNVKIVQGDIVNCDTDAIVNAANWLLCAGSGVCGAIYKAAGKRELKNACKPLKPLAPGNAVITSGFNLTAKYIIHTVAPFYMGGTHGEETVLRLCYLNSFSIASEYGLKTIAIPCLGTGHYRYPFKEAAQIALKAIFFDCDYNFDEIQLVCFTDKDYRDYIEIYDSLSN